MQTVINISDIEAFLSSKQEAERSKNTLTKYRRDLMRFYFFLGEKKEVSKQILLNYKDILCREYLPTSANSMIAALNGLLSYLGLAEYRLQSLKIQRRTFRDTSRELSKEEYQRLVGEAKRSGRNRLCLIMQTLCATGIRVSELRAITVEAVQKGRALVNSKGKVRDIFIPEKLRKLLLVYAMEQGISEGSLFLTSGGKHLDRSNVWREMKDLCGSANVEKSKVFPHNLRHLFAYTFYAVVKDIVRLADLLGHSDLSTTQRYTMTSGSEHERHINSLDLVLVV
jgi:site-specific recombinase XerD